MGETLGRGDKDQQKHVWHRFIQPASSPASSNNHDKPRSFQTLETRRTIFPRKSTGHISLEGSTSRFTSTTSVFVCVINTPDLCHFGFPIRYEVDKTHLYIPSAEGTGTGTFFPASSRRLRLSHLFFPSTLILEGRVGWTDGWMDGIGNPASLFFCVCVRCVQLMSV